MSWVLRKRKNQQETSFMINGGFLLEKLIESSKGKYNSFHVFSAKEIKAATDDFNRHNFIKSYTLYDLYDGFVCDRSVSITNYKYSEDILQQYYFSNIVYAAQMCHKNATKLIGCCLETRTPILVFESLKYGSLLERIVGYGQHDFEPLLWTHRLKIAMEIANVIAYFHVGFPRPILMRNISPYYILFNEEHIPKLFNFTLCVSIPEDKTYVEDTGIVGCSGYIAPEYWKSHKYNEKCDVFSFGILLLVLLTGVKPVEGIGNSASEDEEYPSLRKLVLNHTGNNTFEEIVDPIIVGDGLSLEMKQHLHSFLDLAIRCSSMPPENRPAMVDAAKELRQLYFSSNSC